MGRGSEAFGLGLGSGAGRGEGFERERFGGAVKGVGGEGGTGPRVKMAGEASESGIPAAQFISDVPGALKGRDPGQLLQELQSQYQNYKMLEQRLMQARQRMQTKVRLGTGEGAHHPPVGGTRGVWGATLSPSLNFVSGLSLPNPLNPPHPPPPPPPRLSPPTPPTLFGRFDCPFFEPRDAGDCSLWLAPPAGLVGGVGGDASRDVD